MIEENNLHYLVYETHTMVVFLYMLVLNTIALATSPGARCSVAILTLVDERVVRG